MKGLNLYMLAVCIIWILTTLYAIPSEGSVIPYLHKQGTAMQLIVDGKPLLVLGGELGNSSASSVLHFTDTVELSRFSE